MNPRFDAACEAHGTALKGRNAYLFNTPNQATAAIEAMKVKPVPMPKRAAKRPITLALYSGDKIVAELPKHPGDRFPSWVQEKDHWYTVLGRLPKQEVEIANYDDAVRCLEIEGQPAGWTARKKNGDWTYKSSPSIKTILQSTGLSKPEAEIVMGLAEQDPWKLVTLPFAAEYPGERRWNRNAPQLRIANPVNGPTPTWDMVEQHLMREADPAVNKMPGLRAVGIKTGGDYLRAWYASIIHDPVCRLPYMFWHGDENNGKSSHWEAIERFIISGGIVKADRALTSRSDFNGELVNAVLCIIEEKDISKADGSLAKIKDAVTSPVLSIRALYRQTVQVPNFSHWCQFANDIRNCPMYHGSTRFNCFHVGPLAQELAKETELFPRLEAEASAYTYKLLHMRLPKVEGRLDLPLLDTPSKSLACDMSLPEWLAELAEWVTHFSGTLAELRAASEVWSIPKDMRVVAKQLEAHKPFLATRGIGFIIGDRGREGKTITLKVAA